VPNVNIFLYANDVLVYTSDKILNIGIECLNAVLTIIDRIFNELFFSLAPSKSKCMFFSKCRIFRQIGLWFISLRFNSSFILE